MLGLARSVTRLTLGTSTRLVHSTAAVLARDGASNPLPHADQSASSAFTASTTTTTLLQTKRVVNKYGHGITHHREHTFQTGTFPVSPRKLRMLGNQITNLSVTEAIRQMQVSPKKAAKRVKSALVWARKNAIFQKQMDPDEMVVKLVRVGKGTKFQKKLDIKGRGRFGVIRKPKAHMKFVVWEMQRGVVPEPRDVVERALLAGRLEKRKVKGFKLTRRVWMPLDERKPVINPKPYYNW